MIEQAIYDLVGYGLSTGLVAPEDAIYTTNRVLEALGIEEYCAPQAVVQTQLENILAEILNYAVGQGLTQDNITARDLFDTKIMGLLLARPSEIQRTFFEKYAVSPKAATDYYYKLCQDSDYIRRYRIARDMKWTAETEYGTLDITVNLSKPEKDPKAIAAAKNTRQSGYPKCQLCKENVGYAGRMNHPARQNLRPIPLTVNGSAWMLQYSPYVYYPEHCIVFNAAHTPMAINRQTFQKLLDFVRQFPHYFVGSNADLPIVGGSILTHDHFQGGHYTFAMATAGIETALSFTGFEDVQAGIVKWPMSVIRLSHENPDRLVQLADKILNVWREYTDEQAFIYANTENQPHNTITPIARKNGAVYELDLVLRNNITTQEHPLGVFHPHEELHHIKKENIGLIEVMGLAVLPARLKMELQLLSEKMVAGADLTADEATAKHAKWVADFSANYPEINAQNVQQILQKEVGKVFAKVLEHAGVYKRNAAGKQAFLRFAEAVNQA